MKISSARDLWKVKQGQGDRFEALRRAARERKAREQAKSTT
jgi:hypothetical protein